MLRGGCGWRGPRMRRVLRRRCGMLLAAALEANGQLAGWRSELRGTRAGGCAAASVTRSGTPSWRSCGLTWRCCSGWCSGGRRRGRGRSRLRGGRRRRRRGPRTAGSGKGRQRGPGARAGRRDYSHLPRVEVIWDFPGGGYCCPECGEPFTLLGGSLVRGAAGLAGDRPGGRALPPPVPAGVPLPGAGDGDGAGPAEGDREGPVHQRVHRDAADGAVRGGAEHELAGDGAGPAGRGDLAGDAGGDVRAGRGAAGPAGGGDRGAVAGLVAPARRRDDVAGVRPARRETARRSGGCGCSSARTPCAS